MSGRAIKMPFFLAPESSGDTSKKPKPSDKVRSGGSSSPKLVGLHARQASELTTPKLHIDIKKPVKQKSNKGSPRCCSPKSPFSDFSQMLKVLTRKNEKKAAKSPYREGKEKGAASPKNAGSPKARKSGVASPRPSFAFQNRVKMEVGEGCIKSPKIYQNQIFRDVYDETGQHDKELYSSFADASLEVYQEAANGMGVMMGPRSPGKSGAPKAPGAVLTPPFQPPRDPDSSKVETPVPCADFCNELFRKLTKLQENHSESETASEEARDRAAKRD